jgi:cytochrome c oxidase subunit 4
MASETVTSKATLARVFCALIGLLALTALATLLPPGPWSLAIALGIATAKLALIFLYFMQVRYRGGLIRLFAIAGFFWLAVAGALTFADYFTRGWMF